MSDSNKIKKSSVQIIKQKVNFSQNLWDVGWDFTKQAFAVCCDIRKSSEILRLMI